MTLVDNCSFRQTVLFQNRQPFRPPVIAARAPGMMHGVGLVANLFHKCAIARSRMKIISTSSCNAMFLQWTREGTTCARTVLLGAVLVVVCSLQRYPPCIVHCGFWLQQRNRSKLLLLVQFCISERWNELAVDAVEFTTRGQQMLAGVLLAAQLTGGLQSASVSTIRCSLRFLGEAQKEQGIYMTQADISTFRDTEAVILILSCTT